MNKKIMGMCILIVSIPITKNFQIKAIDAKEGVYWQMMQRLADVIYRLSGTMIYIVCDHGTVRLNGGEVDRQRKKTAYMKQACSIVTHSYPYER